jgi:prepilin-type N-terminal cleavage/methylation domain-containing protein
VKAGLNFKKPCTHRSGGAKPVGEVAFTLIELLVVVAIIAILASLLLPVLARAKIERKKAICISNFHQLHLAWQMYTDDHDGRFPLNDLRSTQGEMESDRGLPAGCSARTTGWTTPMARKWLKHSVALGIT